MNAMDTPSLQRRRWGRYAETGAHTGLSVRYLQRLVAERRIPHHKAGKAILFDLDEVDRWIESGRRDVGSTARKPLG
jgi:excisionase family DNA binding protein